MPIEMPKDIDQEKNRLDSKNAWLWLVELVISDILSYYYVNNPTSITYDGNEYLPLNFHPSDFELKKGSVAGVRSIIITNEALIGILQPHIDAYEGLVDKKVIVTPVNSGYLDLDMSSKTQEFKIITSSSGEDHIVFNLGASNLLTSKFPRDRYLGSYCRYVYLFKGLKCGYSGGETSCDGTLVRCYELENEKRFGGQPGLRAKRVRFA